ncbi:membrane integrity-associated transporter subunit PqiC [Dickeya lacustris]|uniref:Membrane integrity-associated transporter subunit PqiC n=1 Tax=Dickeya lacustris TaxID=2259638 RepID=A0ABY8G941_9GAMM|nr:membrane integrity-associated transporter subunit PqiC [Dickeya lacustris]WFN56472.1 membrane integrity-associated transporter subunit PqiC [Dickeya lacustris]
MMKGWPLWLVLVLGGCASPQKIYYQLPVTAQKAQTSVTQAQGRQLWVAPIALADSLAGSGLVFQTSPVRYTIAANNLWASPLDQQLQQALVASLRHDLAGWHVFSSGPVTKNTASLRVNVTAFQGRFDGRAVIQGEWVLQDEQRVVTQPFALEIALREDGYDALVSALAQGWQQVAESVRRQAAAGV